MLRSLVRRGAIAATAVALTQVLPTPQPLFVHAEPSVQDTLKRARCIDASAYRAVKLPTRAEQIQRLKEEEVDVLVVGGGCVGTGVALDATMRGLKVACVDADDFAAGTSSKSSRLVHGGVRYLQRLFFSADLSAYGLVTEALAERKHMLKMASFSIKPLPIMIPIYSWLDGPMYWVGAKIYDLIAGSGRGVPASYFIGHDEALYRFPQLRREGLKGAVVYYDGVHNDARTNVLLALTAAEQGARIANYVKVVGLVRSEDGARLAGAEVEDTVSGERFTIRAKSVVNATGPFADSLRAMEDEDVAPRIVPAGGVHVVLPDYMSPENMGLIVPKTSDGRVLFFLPWEGNTLCGTTDSETEITMLPKPTKQEVSFIVEEANRFLAPEHTVLPEHIRASWSGIRPLVMSEDMAKRTAERKKQGLEVDKGDTKNFSRSHVLEVGPRGLVSVMGGKWTTYRSMAQDTVDMLLKDSAALGADPSPRVAAARSTPPKTLGFPVIGSDRSGEIAPNGRYDLVEISLREDFGIGREEAIYLRSNYGVRALDIAHIIRAKPELNKRISPAFPALEAEVLFAARHEMATRAVDVISRRTRLSFVDSAAADKALNRVVDLLAAELGWSYSRKQQEIQIAKEYLETMHA